MAESSNPSDAAVDIRSGPGYCLLRIRVTPKASRNELAGVSGGCLRIRVQAPPVDGAANARTGEFLAEILGLPRRNVVLERGQTAREKVFRVSGADEDEIRRRIRSAAGGGGRASRD